MTDKTHPLRRREPLVPTADAPLFHLVDLFAGCGGLTLGAQMAALDAGYRLDVRLAVDQEASAVNVYKANFKTADTVRAVGVETLFASSLTASLQKRETKLAKAVGRVDLLLGGPPCQGHSNLNNHTRRNDPKNALYLYMVRAAQVLRPRIVLIENVQAVLHDTFAASNVVEVARGRLKALGYQVHDRVVPLVDLGVAQQRKRHILLATEPGLRHPATVFDALNKNRNQIGRDLRWAIGDLIHAQPEGIDMPPKASQENVRRMNYLITKNLYDLPNTERPKCHQGDHSYKSMYGRLRWDQPAQTITSGFSSIGQGRYMHPELARALTIHEAARIQGFPDYFDFTSVSLRTDLATMIGNAVPPQLSAAVLRHLLKPTET